MNTPFHYRRSYRGPIRGLVLDWAGTILDYGSLAPVAAFLEVFRREHVEITRDEARAFMGTYKKDHIRSLTKLPRIRDRWREIHGKVPDESDVERIYEAFSPIQIDCLADHAELIPGCLDTISALRSRGIKIGSNTGYSAPMMKVVLREASRQGFTADAMVCADDVPQGRPAPWMALENARRLGIFPLEALAKVDDTIPGIEEGLNAGMWSIGVVKTGNELGLSRQEVESLPSDEFDRRLEEGRSRLARAGAHAVIDSIADLIPCIESIERRLAAGEKP
jgi:phosphonoacetaldehyde hydrolase